MGNGEARDITEPAERHETNVEARQRHEVALLLTAAAVLAALMGGRAAALSASASTSWQNGTRAQVKQAAAYVAQIRSVYGVEVPRAISVTEVRLRAEELDKVVADENVERRTLGLLKDEKAVQEEILEASLPTSVLAKRPEYQTSVGFDPARMLADEDTVVPVVLANEPGLLNLDPEGLHEEGNETSDHAIRMLGSTVPVALAFLSGSLGRIMLRWRRIFLMIGILFLAFGVVSAVAVEVA